jgi:hypothetical protein
VAMSVQSGLHIRARILKLTPSMHRSDRRF